MYNFQAKFLVSMCAILLLIIGWEMLPEQNTSLSVAEENLAQKDVGSLLADITALVKMPPLRKFSMIVDRPLFDPTRRPAPTAAGSTGEVSVVFRQMVLTGVIITPEKNMAILQNKKQKQTIRLEPGESVQSWLLDEIHPDRAIFRKGTQLQELFLVKKPAKQERAVKSLAPRPDDKPLIGKKM
ncbi:MAG: hypothetical protein QGH93_08880 [Gammaproteobacteria bacterium]|jgi:general secretion pathway protein N|nr:hypothetical protein [Chromatiales bacterium]MDP6674942.1 hypothetical protein [Gammaproteobacteria bacterium]